MLHVSLSLLFTEIILDTSEDEQQQTKSDAIETKAQKAEKEK